jgi:Na+/H+-translocating membrane pyrophosphatase
LWNDTRSFLCFGNEFVGKAAMDMVYEASSVQGNSEYKELENPEYAKCVDISTKAAFARNDVTEF